MNSKQQRVVVLGASDKEDRYSNRAVHELIAHEHQVIPVNPNIAMIADVPVVASLAEISGAVDTLTIYLAPEKSSPLTGEIIRLKPKRVIFNPGAENPAVQQALHDHGIATEQACTLVLLHTEQF